ncbi:zf-HC2 domain-containing protein [Actinomadura sp. NPDC047616]|uniref:anti-sigma factor family protein n=1 Tax=Actinomadura sp. NPDC047616 TaxID=3155914 RepID=UPI0033E6B0AE
MNPAHLDYDTLADLAEGLLDDDQAASVTAHLDTCAECRERSDELSDVSRILAEAPVPSMPADLASRIDSAIAAESMHSAAVVSLAQRRGRRHWRILSAAAAAVVVVGGGGMVGYQLLGDSSDAGHQTAASTPVQDPPDRRSLSPGAAPSPNAMQGPGYTVLHSGTDYRAGTLVRQITGLVGNGGRQLTLSGGEPDGRLSQCVDRIAQGKVPKVVDVATYEGRPATVIALPTGGSGGLDVWVVGPGCSSGDTDLIKHEKTER